MTALDHDLPSNAPLPAGRFEYVPALDGLRGLAAVMVIAFHFCHDRPAPRNVAGRVLLLSANLGQTGVDLFFVLSGFLITGILLASRGTRRPFLRFYARRSLRIFPLYYLALVLISVASAVSIGDWRFLPRTWWYWVYLQNIPMTFWPLRFYHFPAFHPDHFWSLAVEEHFYLIWPALVLLLSRRHLVWALVFLFFLSCGVRLAMLVSGVGNPYLFTFSRLESLSVGAMIAVMWTYPATVGFIGRHIGRVLLIGIPPLAIGYVLISGKNLPAVLLVKVPLLAVLYGGVLVLVRTSGPGTVIHGVLAHRVARNFGKYSYGLYVYHLAVVELANRFLASRPAIGGPAFYLPGLIGVIGVTYGVAVVSWHVWERPFLRLKRHFEAGAV